MTAKSTITVDFAKRMKARVPLSRRLRPVVLHLLALAAAIVFLYPLAWMAAASIKPSWAVFRAPLAFIVEGMSFDAYVMLFRTTPFLTYTLNSVLYATAGAALSIALGMFASYGFSRFRFRGQEAVLLVILTTQLIPGLVAAIPTYLLMRELGLLDSRAGLILLYSTLSLPFSVWVLKGHFDTIPKELDDAARMDGASRLRVVLRIHLPLLLPGISSLFLILFVQKWGEFALASVLLREAVLYPLTVGTNFLIGPDESDFALIAAASLVNIVPILALFIVLQRFLVAGLTNGAVKS